MSLFKLVPGEETITDNLISSVTAGSTVFKAIPAGNSGIINIVESMQIATNDIIPGSYLANKIPTCILKEYELVTNSSVSQLLYYLRSIGSGTTTGSINDAITNFGNTLGNVGNQAEKLLSGPKGGIIKDFIGDNTKEILDKAVQPLQEILKNNEQFSGSMTPYQNLYLRKATNFKYIFPYFTDKKKDITNAFSDSQTGLLAGNVFANIVGGAKATYENIAKNLLFATPGAYIEQPKFFDMGNSNESYEINFELINTVNSDKVQAHFDLLFLLAYQNLPFRKDIARVTLPKIYTFIIPGEIYLPFAYISSLKIDFVGNRRKLKLIHPKGIASDVGPTNNTTGGTPTDCIVPEVYSVSMTITGLTTPAANYMIADELFKITSTSVKTTQIPETTYPGLVPVRPVDVPLVPLTTQIARLNNNNTNTINQVTGNIISPTPTLLPTVPRQGAAPLTGSIPLRAPGEILPR
jgi:hypothetical protein